MMLVYGLTVTISGLWVIRMISNKSLIFKRTILDIPLGLFLASQIISTILSMDLHTSIWGYYSRSNGGLLSVISYFILYYAFVSNFKKHDVLKFLKAAVIAGGLASLYAIPEHFGVSPSCIILTGEATVNCWVQEVQARVFGTIGQPNWLAAYLAMLIFPAIYFFITAKSKLAQAIYFLLTTIYYLAFTFTYSRGATLGLIAGFGVMGLATAFSSWKSKDYIQLKLLSFITLTCIVLSLLFGSALTEFRLLKDPAIPLRPGLTQSAGTQLENGGTESGKIRLIVWQGAINIFKAHPLFGSGVETFAYAYYLYRPNEHNLVSEWDFLYNKAHNEYLNYLATTGAFGFLSYMAIILIFGGFSIKYYVSSLKNKPLATDYLLLTTLLAGYISYLVQNFFLFSVVIIAVLFYLFPAFALTYLESTKDLSEKSFITKTINSLIALITKNKIISRIVSVLVVIIVLVLLNTLLSLWEADTNYKKGSDFNDLGNPGRAYNYLIEAVRLNSGEPLYLAELGNSAVSSALALAEEDATTSAQLKDDSVFFTDLGLSISPVNTTILRTAIRTYFQLSLIDPEYKNKTLEIVDRSISLAPTDPKLLLNKAVILTQFERNEDAVNAYLQAIEMKPNYRDARLPLADLYIKMGEKEKARQQLDMVLKMIPGDPDALSLLEQLK